MPGGPNRLNYLFSITCLDSLRSHCATHAQKIDMQR